MIQKFIERYKVDHEVCDGLIEYFEENVEYKNDGEVGDGVVDKKIKNSKDVSFMNGSNDIRLKIMLKNMVLEMQ